MAKWTGIHLYNLLTKSTKELQKLYPDYSRGTISGKKNYWTKQLKEGKIQMPPKPRLE